jgi:hypothetical protein
MFRVIKSTAEQIVLPEFLLSILWITAGCCDKPALATAAIFPGKILGQRTPRRNGVKSQSMGLPARAIEAYREALMQKTSVPVHAGLILREQLAEAIVPLAPRLAAS